MAKLFVSYARENGPIALSLVNDLSEFGHDAFFDRDIRGGQQWWDVLLDRIAGSDGFLPVLSEDYRMSEPCRRETQWANAMGIPILPIDLGEVSPQLFPMVIQRANWVRYDQTSREALSRLLRAVQDLPPAVAPDPLPARPDVPAEYLSVETEIAGSTDIPRARQLEILSDLRGRLDSRDPQAVLVLLRELRRRPEVTVEVAKQIDALLAEHAQPGPPFGQGAPGAGGYGHSGPNAGYLPPPGPMYTGPTSTGPTSPGPTSTGPRPPGPVYGAAPHPGWEGRLGPAGASERARYRRAKVPAIVALSVGGFFLLGAIGSVGDKTTSPAAAGVAAVVGIVASVVGLVLLMTMFSARSHARNIALERYNARFLEPSTVPLSSMPMFDSWVHNVERMRPFHP